MISVMNEPCGWPGARIGRCWPVLMNTSLCARRRFGDLVDVGQREARGRARRRRCPTISASNAVIMPSAETPALIFAAADGRLPVDEMLFLAIEHQLHRRARLLREPRADQPFGAELQLAAEAAAHVLADDADVRLRNAQAAGEVVARGVDALRRDPRRQLVAVPLAHRAVRLHAGVRDDVRRVGLLERVRRRLESRREIAGFLRLAAAHVAGREHLRRACRPAPDSTLITCRQRLRSRP